MKYILADKSKVMQVHIDITGHRCKGHQVVLNEKEVMLSSTIEGASLEERASSIGGTIYTAAELIDIINRK